jgi:hypothetical protein
MSGMGEKNEKQLKVGEEFLASRIVIYVKIFSVVVCGERKTSEFLDDQAI